MEEWCRRPIFHNELYAVASSLLKMFCFQRKEQTVCVIYGENMSLKIDGLEFENRCIKKQKTIFHCNYRFILNSAMIDWRAEQVNHPKAAS